MGKRVFAPAGWCNRVSREGIEAAPLYLGGALLAGNISRAHPLTFRSLVRFRDERYYATLRIAVKSSIDDIFFRPIHKFPRLKGASASKHRWIVWIPTGFVG